MAEWHLLEVEQKGKQRIYSLNKDTIVPLMQLVEKHVSKFCGKECSKRKWKQNKFISIMEQQQ